MVYFGPKALLRLKKDYILEGLLQFAFFISTIVYFTVSYHDKTTQIQIVQTSALLLLFRLPHVIPLLLEIQDFKVILHTSKRMFSPFLNVLFSLYLVVFTFNAIGITAFSGLVTLGRI